MANILSAEQRKVVESPKTRIVVLSASSSGKTFALIERVRWILQHGGNPERMICVTFTNNAAAEIKQRLGEDYKDGMFIGTIHGYANKLLTDNGINTSAVRKNDDFDGLFQLVKKNKSVINPIGFLALDEAQDSTENQFNFIFDILCPSAFLVVGDIRQTIYSWSGADPSLLLGISKRSDVTTYNLIENHRNAKEILQYSNWVLRQMRDIPKMQVRGLREEEGLVEEIRERSVVDLIKRESDNGTGYGEWTILCRSNARVQEFIYKLENKGIPCITFRQAQGSLEELAEKMYKNAVKVLTIHSSKGLEFNKVIIADQRWREDEDKRLMYVAVTRARDELYFLKG